MKKRILQSIVMLLGFSLVFFSVKEKLYAATQIKELEQKLNQTIKKDANVGSSVQKWHEEQDKLLDEMRRMKIEIQWLTLQNNKYSHYVASNQRKIDELQKINSEYAVIELQLENAMHDYFEELQNIIANDKPFLEKERQDRLVFLRDTLDSPELSIGEKFRRFAEALSVEAAYGVEIKNEFHSAKLGETETDLNIMRIGRMAMYALTLDNKKSGIWNQEKQIFEPTTEEEHRYILALQTAIANKQFYQLLALPIGNIKNEQ